MSTAHSDHPEVAARLPSDSIAEHRRRPVILVSSPRSGSTLVQRILNTHPQLTVWGEHIGILRHLREIERTIVEYAGIIDRGGVQRAALVGPLQDLDGLSEHINPFSTDEIDERLAAMTLELFTHSLPPDVRWGFKEVRYDGDDLEFLVTLFPGARIVILARDPAEQVSSYLRAPWRSKPDLATEEGRAKLSAMAARLAAGWTRMYLSFHEFAERHPDNVVKLRYDRLGADVLDIPGLFDAVGTTMPDPSAVHRVLDKKSGSSDRTAAWEAADRAVLDETIADLRFPAGHDVALRSFLP